MILVDTSVWIDHIGRAPDEILVSLMAQRQVATHPFVIGELAMSNMRQRTVILAELGKLPTVTVAAHAEVMFLVDEHRLFASGIGYIDAHLVAAAQLTPDVTLWTRDRRLHNVANHLGLAAHLLN